MKKSINIDIVKRKRIRQQFGRFKELCPDVPLGKVHLFDAATIDGIPCDPPDICLAGGELGIEFTDFLHGANDVDGSALKASEIFFHKVIEEAQKQFKLQSSLILSVQPLWTNNAHPKQSELLTFANALVELVCRSIPEYYNGHIDLEPSDFIGTGLEKYLIALGISKQDPNSYPTWANRHSGQVEAGVKDMEFHVRKKEADLPRYREKVKSVWLVIFASGRPISSYVYPDATIKPGCITSEFDRVYFFNETYNDNQLICLTPNKN